MHSIDRNVEMEKEDDEGSAFDLKSSVLEASVDMVGIDNEKMYENEKNENEDGKGRVRQSWKRQCLWQNCRGTE